MQINRIHREGSLRIRAWLVAAAVAVGLPTVLVGASSAAALPEGGTSAPAVGGGGGGTQIWVARDSGPHGAFDTVAGMATSPDGSTVYVAGTSAGTFFVAAHDALTGATRWAVRTADPDGYQIFAEAVSLSADGTRLFVTGDVERSVDTRDGRTIAYDTVDGSVLWASDVMMQDRWEFIPRRIAVSPDGSRVLVTGSRTGNRGPNDFWDYYTLSYAAATGTLVWKATYDGPAHGGDTAEGLGVSPDGTSVFVTGTSKGTGRYERDFVTIAYSADDGAQRWKARYAVGVDDFAVGLAVSPDGSRVYVAGYGRAAITDPHDYTLAAYDAVTGGQVGVATFADGNDDYAASLAIGGDGSRVYVTGSGSQDFLTVAFDASTLEPAWHARYDGGHGIDDAYSVAVSPDGAHVYVTGEGERSRIACFGDIQATGYATVRYDAATGAQGWVARYAGLKRDPDQARQVAAGVDGSSVFVTGNSDSVCKGSDVATLAYQA